MSTSKHSPPPWRVTATGYIVNEAGHIIAKMNHWPYVGYAFTPRDEQARADGVLITRAPDLLRMCAGLRLVLDATALFVPDGAHPSITTMLDESAKLLREITEPMP